ncbi:MAG: glycosyltransferase [Paraglaciecola sp.]|nr:glycosyltransferase [Paraglaciecola sp.]NCT48611.1 glycosyltransferase [Paraglaciecola sp.]
MVNTLPLVSVIVTTFERPQFLLAACKSVQQQSYKNIELIVVDDNSSCSYANVLTHLQDLNLHYIKRSQNGGGSAARNTGIIAAKGEYIAFLDDDDEWAVSKIEKQMTRLCDKVQAVHCGYTLLSSGKPRIEQQTLITFSDLCENNKLASTSGLLAKASLLRELRFDETLARSQDWDIYLRLARETPIAYVNEALYIYNDGGHLRMTNKLASLSIAEFRAQLAMVKKHQTSLVKQAYTQHIANLILRSIKHRNDPFLLLVMCMSEIGFWPTLYHLARLGKEKYR